MEQSGMYKLGSPYAVCLINATPDETGHGEVTEELWRIYYLVATEALKYLYKIGTEHFIVLISEYDEITASEYFSGDWDLMLEGARKSAAAIKEQLLSFPHPTISQIDVFVGENTGFLGCHELCVFIPIATPEAEIYAISCIVDAYAYGGTDVA